MSEKPFTQNKVEQKQSDLVISLQLMLRQIWVQ